MDAIGYQAAVALALLALPTAAAADDTWTEPFPGVRHLARTTSAPNRIHATVVDLCAAGVSARATREAEGDRTVSAFGTLVDAELAVNGDFFQFADGSREPLGLAMGAGDLWAGSDTDSTTHGFIALGDGRTLVSNPPDLAAVEPWMDDAVGGNILVVFNGQVTGDTGSFCTTRNPRTAAGISEDGRRLVLAVVDGRSASSIGMRCDELGRLMVELGAHDAINLDGGGSTTMWMKGRGVLNVPSDGSQRTVANHLAVHADGGQVPPEACPVAPDFDVEVNVLGNRETGAPVPGAVEGDAFQAEILIQNLSARRMPDVIAGYWLEAPYHTATGYAIQTDHPAHDRSSWTPSPAGTDEDNPPGDMLGDDGFLALGGLEPGETVRILVDLAATRYSVGAVDHPDIRAWIKHVPYVYGEQDAWDQEPTNANHVGRLLQDFAQLDILGADEWHFGGGADQLEGVRACDGAAGALAVDPDRGALEGAPCVRFPAWTAVDAGVFDQMVVRARLSGRVTVRWAREGGEPREARFEPDGDEIATWVVPLDEHGGWRDVARTLEIEQERGEIVLDAVFFQDAAGRVTSSHGEPFVTAAPVDLLGDPSDPSDPSDPPGPSDPSAPGEPEIGATGCRTAGGAGGLPFAAALVGLLALRRRRGAGSAGAVQKLVSGS